MSKQPPSAPTARAIGPCPTIIQIVGRPGSGSLPKTIAPPDHPPHHPTTHVWNGRQFPTGTRYGFAYYFLATADQKTSTNQLAYIYASEYVWNGRQYLTGTRWWLCLFSGYSRPENLNESSGIYLCGEVGLEARAILAIPLATQSPEAP